MDKSVNCCELSDTTLESLCIIEKSKKYILLIIVAVFISYYTVNLQEQQLIAAECCPEELNNIPDVFPYRVSANIMTLVALVFFYLLSKQTLCNNTDPTNCSPSYNYTASTLVLIATMIRLYDIFYTNDRGGTGTSISPGVEESDIEQDE